MRVQYWKHWLCSKLHTWHTTRTTLQWKSDWNLVRVVCSFEHSLCHAIPNRRIPLYMSILTFFIGLMKSLVLPNHTHTRAERGKRKRSTVPSVSRADCGQAAERLKSNARHRAYLQGVPLRQLERLHAVLRDRLCGRTLEQSLASLRLDPNQDLNKLSDEELARKKAQMDVTFEQNRKRRDDPDFVYDLEVEFPKADDHETCSWDESEDGF